MRITPEEMREEDFSDNDIFVFGSNESGIHGAGAARFALNLGARMGQGFGMSGNTFAIPSKDWFIRTLPVEDIAFYVNRFIEYTKQVSTHIPSEIMHFYVTKIGCGLAGYTAKEIAPLFKDCIDLNNVYLPQEFIDIINENIAYDTANRSEVRESSGL